MPVGDNTQPADTNPESELVWIGDKEIFTIGTMPVKIWHLLVGLVVLSILIPLLFRKKGKK